MSPHSFPRSIGGRGGDGGCGPPGCVYYHPMPNIRAVDMLILDDIFEMGGGYVIDFSDRTFAQFFADELNIDINDPRYSVNGGSKGKRMRCFLQTVDKPTAIRTLETMWQYREAVRDGRAR